MKHIYLLCENYNGTLYGIGTYTRTLLRIFEGEALLVTIVELLSHNKKVKIVEDGNLRYIYIPDTLSRKRCKYYHRNVFYLLYPYINTTEDNILHINYRNCIDLVSLLRQHFHFYVLLTWHFSTEILFFAGKQVKKTLQKIENQEPLDVKENMFVTTIQQESVLINHFCDKIILVAKHSYFSIRENYKLPEDKIEIIYNALSDEKIEVLDKESIRGKFKLSLDEKILLFVGRLDDNKNVFLLTKCLHTVIQRYGNIRLVIVGNGNFMESLEVAYPDYTYITFTGFLEQENLHQLYSIADIGVIPSHNEEFGYVAVEMMMHGLPVIANRTGGLAEIIENGVSGELVDLYEEDNEQEAESLLAEAIIALLADEAKQKKYSLNARKRYLDYFGMKAYKDKMLDIYNGK